MANDILDPSALLSQLPVLLPASERTLKSAQDGIASLLHAAMTSLGFRLISVDDSGPPQTYTNNTLPSGWNSHGPSHYTLRYKHDQSSLEFVMKVSKLGSRTMVNAIALESDKAASFDVSTDDFMSPSFFPHDLSASDAGPLVHGFIGSNRVNDLVTQFKLKIVQKLVPGLRKEGYSEVSEESTPAAGSASQLRRPAPPPARPDPVYPPHRPDPDQPGLPYSHLPPSNPLEIGRRDRDPFPGLGPNPYAPPPLFPGGAGGDGMFVGPGHPIFGGRGGGRPGNPLGPNTGPWGGDGFLPPMGAPPGARFDPIGPSPGPFGRFPPGGGNMRGPDNDEFMPPGSGDHMYM